MKLNLKKLLLPIFCIFMFFFAVLKVNAAEFIECDGSTYIITLDHQELASLNQAGSSINTIDNRYTITNRGALVEDIDNFPECFLTQTDYPHTPSLTCIRHLDEEKVSMGVTLAGERYGGTSATRTWTRIDIWDSETNTNKLVKICQTLREPQYQDVTSPLSSLISIFRGQ